MNRVTGKIFVDVADCPCCSSDRVYVGVMSAQSWGVKCNACGLNVTRWTPDNFSMKNISRYLLRNGMSSSELEAMTRADRWLTACKIQTLRRAIKAWNTRPHSNTRRN